MAARGGINCVPCTLILAFLLEAVDPPSVIVSIVGVAFPFGVSIVGLNEPVKSVGTPETLNRIELENPFAVGVAVI